MRATSSVLDVPLIVKMRWVAPNCTTLWGGAPDVQARRAALPQRLCTWAPAERAPGPRGPATNPIHPFPPPLPHIPLPHRSKGYHDGADVAHELIPQVASWGAAAVTLHGRTRQQRYSRQADWDYIQRCGRVAAGAGLPFVGNGDIMSPSEWGAHMAGGAVTTCMIGRGALIKPWIFTGAGRAGRGVAGGGG